MRILFLSNSYLPSRRASSVQVMAMAAAFARHGHSVTVVAKACPEREEAGIADVYDHYGVPHSFEIRKLPRPVLKGGGGVFAYSQRQLIHQLVGQTDLVFSRDYVGSWFATRLKVPVVIEAHGVPYGRFSRFFLRKTAGSQTCHRVVAISELLRRDLLDSGLVPSGAEIIVAHDGARRPEGDFTPSFAHRGQPKIGYIGSFYRGRGIDIVMQLAARIPDARFHLVGGADADLQRIIGIREVPRNVTLHGYVAPSRLVTLYDDMDILLMPYQENLHVASGAKDTSSWMSPLKMFEYMASGKAIISSDFAVLREVLSDGKNAILVPPKDVDAWQSAIISLISDQEKARLLGERARQDLIKHYTWEARAEKILHGI